jgi:hypothetical protein
MANRSEGRDKATRSVAVRPQVAPVALGSELDPLAGKLLQMLAHVPLKDNRHGAGVEIELCREPRPDAAATRERAHRRFAQSAPIRRGGAERLARVGTTHPRRHTAAPSGCGDPRLLLAASL